MHRSFRFVDRRLWMAGLAALTLSACNSGTSSSAPAITSFTAAPSTIAPGGSSTLAWSVSDATSLSIDNGVGSVTGSSIVVSPTTTTVYILTATNAGGNTTAAATVTVTPLPVPVIASFTATRATIARGATSTLAWSVMGATAISIAPGVGTVAGTSVVVTPTATTTYTLTATNAGGPATATATVTVPATSILLASASGGPGRLGELTDLPLTLSGSASSFHPFTGRPYIEGNPAMDGQGLVWNGADNKFYGTGSGSPPPPSSTRSRQS